MLAIATDGILRYVGVVEILEREIEAFAAQDIFVCLGDGLQVLLHNIIVGRIGVGSRDDGHDYVGLSRRETE